jgi:hypothetical protein
MQPATPTDAYDAPTCGQGLAEHSALPAKCGELMARVADVLEQHMTALDMSDERSRKEHAAYRRLVTDHRATAASLRAIADAMAGYRGLPMGRHNAAAMMNPTTVGLFEKLVRVEEETSALLRERVERDHDMLRQMESAPKP